MTGKSLSTAAQGCAVAAPFLLAGAFSIHVAGDVCQFAPPHRSGLTERAFLWALALLTVVAGIAFSIAGIRVRGWSGAYALIVLLVELGVVLLLGLGLDPCGLS